MSTYMYDSWAEITKVYIFFFFFFFAWGFYLFTTIFFLDGDFLQEALHRILMILLYSY